MTEPQPGRDAEAATDPVEPITPADPTAPATAAPATAAPATAAVAAGPAEPVRPRSRRKPLVLVSAALAVVVLIAAAVVIVLLTTTKSQTGKGDASPTAAIDDFLNAVYDGNPADAVKYVCAQSRDGGRLADQLATIRARGSAPYAPSRYQWDALTVTHQTSTEATVTTTLHMSTPDERTSSLRMTFTTINDHGWWVCEVKTGTQ